MADSAAQAKLLEQGKVSLRTRLSYGFGCIGRDATYTLVNNFILTFLTLAVGLTNWQLGAIGVIMVIARIWDAINDPIMGGILDRAHTRWGKFKPFILIGAILNSVFTIILFSDPVKNEALFVIIFAISYILWDMTYTMNDIAYWSMLPSLTVNPKERERVSTLARIGANIGLFAVTAAVPLLTSIGRASDMYFYIALSVALLFIACQVLVVWGVQEQKNVITCAQGNTKLRDTLKVIFKNDQLLAIIVSILLFNIGYFTTTSFGMQFFYFDYGNYKGLEFMIFALTIGVTQIVTLLIYPLLAKKMNRRQLFALAIALVALGYVGFMCVGYVLPMHMVALCIIGFILFAGQAIIQLLTLVLLADTVEYGQWKLGTRNESVIFSLNPFIVKLSSAIQAAIFTVTMVFSGLNKYSNQLSEIDKTPGLTEAQIKDAGNALIATIPAGSLLIMRLSMIVIPLLLILACFVVYLRKYKIDDAMYGKILEDLTTRAAKETAES